MSSGYPLINLKANYKLLLTFFKSVYISLKQTFVDIFLKGGRLSGPELARLVVKRVTQDNLYFYVLLNITCVVNDRLLLS